VGKHPCRPPFYFSLPAPIQGEKLYSGGMAIRGCQPLVAGFKRSARLPKGYGQAPAQLREGRNAERYLFFWNQRIFTEGEGQQIGDGRGFDKLVFVPMGNKGYGLLLLAFVLQHYLPATAAG
jgi:hypothetical protein